MTRIGERALEAGARDVRHAWWSLMLFPLSLLGAFVIGEGLASLFGHPIDGSADVPLWVMVAAGGPALLVFVVPALVAVVFAKQAERLGNQGGRAPMRIAVGLAAVFVLLNVVQGLLTVALG